MTNAERAEAVIAEMCALHPYASRPAWRAIVERALSSQEAEIERLTAKVERYEARLEIDHCYVMTDSGDELERRDVPEDERETWPDGITCRDETIRLLEEQIAALTPLPEGGQ